MRSARSAAPGPGIGSTVQRSPCVVELVDAVRRPSSVLGPVLWEAFFLLMRRLCRAVRAMGVDLVWGIFRFPVPWGGLYRSLRSYHPRIREKNSGKLRNLGKIFLKPA